MICNSISNALNLENVDIEGRNIRYRATTISKNIRYRSIKDRYRLTTISKKHRYRSSKLRYRYIPISNKTSISRNAHSISVYDIEDFLLRYRFSCSSISVFFCRIQPGPWAAYSVQDTDCSVHIALQINHYPLLMRRLGRPQPPQRRLHSAARPHPLHRAQHRTQLPERAQERVIQARNAGARDSWRQELTGAKFAAAEAAAAEAAAAAAGAGINGTQERVILGDTN